MSAITGIFYRDGRSVDSKMIKKMNDQLSHRGLDGSKTWFEGSVAFGHQMLHTTPESLQEELPFIDDETGLVITADARIDNRKELSELLEMENNKNVPDSLFIIRAYEKWGESCPENLLGDFAFAIWDPDKEQLFCARDHMGVKPFYYHLSDDGFFFATEMKALFTISDVPYELNELKVALYLMQEDTDKKLTFYKNIFCLTAARSLRISQNHNQLEKYWELDPLHQIILDSDEEYIQRFQDIFAEAIQCRLRSAFPIGFELSGGLDSSSVVCMAKDISKNVHSNLTNINTFSMIFNDFPQVDESYYIKSVTDACEANPQLIISDKISPLEKIESILWHQEQPFYTPNMAILCNMYKTMKEDNIRIVLGGNGGDETVSHGKNYLRDLATSMQWKKLIREINGYSKRVNIGIFNLIIKEVLIPLTPIFLKNFYHEIVPFLIMKRSENKCFILNKEFVRSIDFECNNNSYFNQNKTIKTAKEAHYFDINNISNQSTMEMIDKIVSEFSIEPRYPFFDKRLVEFSYAIPTEMKFRFGWNRYIQRMAMDNILPKEVQWRPLKKFFNPVYEKNLLLFENNILKKIFCHENLMIKEYVDIEMIKEFYKEYNSGRGDIVSNRYIWLVTLLDLWLNESINKKKINLVNERRA
ncbi:lasso peptide isopeptide bond-forming cyclase [Methanobacterium sp. SMA-27]|uniref:lasso peptide isopeptide bond-forming cyclase n=1 Tax=Methanobacterium sp. SMA-27 TaxID=1495336 RepID=UPI00064F6EA4|nr:lasso peptide isopeptide bond-forming cyclase [Methanobacterium sp. SMA-27]